MHARKEISIFFESMEFQLSKANFIFKIGQKLASVSSFEFWGKKIQNFSENSKKLCLFSDARTNFEIAYRSEFLSNFKTKMSVRKLTFHTFQKKNFHFFPACILHAVLSKSLPSIFWLVCVQNARKKRN